MRTVRIRAHPLGFRFDLRGWNPLRAIAIPIGIDRHPDRHPRPGVRSPVWNPSRFARARLRQMEPSGIRFRFSLPSARRRMEPFALRAFSLPFGSPVPVQPANRTLRHRAQERATGRSPGRQHERTGKPTPPRPGWIVARSGASFQLTA